MRLARLLKRGKEISVRKLLILVAIAFVAQALGAAESQAVITAPITNGAASVPPIPTFPEAGDTPPPGQEIRDPIEPAASCGDWYVQSTYVGQPTGSTWWEYACTFIEPAPCAPMCNGTWRSSTWIDYFYWDGSQAVFYGENYVAVDHSMMFWDCEFWWDEHTSEWHALFDCF